MRSRMGFWKLNLGRGAVSAGRQVIYLFWLVWPVPKQLKSNSVRQGPAWGK